MNVYFQILIPIFVTFAALLAIAIVRKYFKVEAIVILIVLGLFGGGILTSYIMDSNGRSKTEKLMSDSAAVSLMIAEQYMMQGQYDSAVEILDELNKESANDERIQLAQARCALLKGSYGMAVQLYDNLGEEVDEEKKEAELLYLGEQNTDNAIVEYIQQNGEEASDYGLSNSKVKKGNYDDAKRVICERIQEDYESQKDTYGEETAEAVEQAMVVMNEFDRVVRGNTSDSEEGSYEIALEKLGNLMTEEIYLDSNRQLRVARMKGYIILGDYGKIAELANDYITAEELTVLAELYVKGLIDESDFSEEYLGIKGDEVDGIVKHCEEILANNKEDFSKEQYEKYEQRIEQLKTQMKDPVTFMLRCDLIEDIENGRGVMKSKNYIALAKIENQAGNIELAHRYIDDALGTAFESNDDNYSVPMMQLSGIIQGNSETEEVKNVAEYVDKALDHSLPTGIESELLNTTVTDNATSVADETAEAEFNKEMSGYVKEATAKLNIGVINKDNFPKVQARVQIQSDNWVTVDEIREHLQVYDCGSQIEDFTLEKLTYSKANVILLCDVSGSMSGSEERLKDAIRRFAEDMQEGEFVSVIGFNSNIVFVETFSNDAEVVASYAEKIATGGGTAVYSSVLYAIEQCTVDVNSNNVIIAMTDGQDGSPAKEGDMYNILGAAAASKDVTVYTLGMGDVDTAYLEMMADSGNGSFLYAEDFDELNNFYDFIHGQLENQYILTYEAKNKTLNERELKISIDDETGFAKKTYYLQEREYTNEGSDAYNPYTVSDAEISIYGFATKFLYKSSKDQTIKLQGEGFDEDDDITITIEDSVRYSLQATCIDSETIEVIIPAEVASGVYDATISIRGDSVILESELTVAVSGTAKHFKFGSYNFTSLKSYIDDSGNTVLSGNVTMNGWLMFKGDITIRSPYTDVEKIWIIDNDGSYVNYNNSSSMGLAKLMGEKGLAFSVKPFGEFCLYNAEYTPSEYEEFPVEQITHGEQFNVLFLFIENANVMIYPDMLRVNAGSINFDLPFQKQLLRNLDILKMKTLKYESDMLVGATQIAMLGTVKYEDDDDYGGETKGVEFTMVSFPLRMKELSVEINTLDNDYSFAAAVTFKAIKDMVDTFELNFAIKGGKFDAIGFRAEGDAEKTIIQSPIPISIGDFGFELSGFSEYESDASTLSNVLGNTLTIEFNVNAASLNKYAPKIADMISKEKDIALATLKDCKLSLRLKEFRLAFEADLVFCTILEIGKCEIKLGSFDYTNALIGYNNETQYGLQAAVTLGNEWESTNLTMQLTGKAEVTLGYPYTGIWLDGDADFDLRWWIAKADIDVAGDILIGGYKNSSDNFQFSIIVRGTNTKGEYSGFHLYVTKNTGIGLYTY